MDVTGLTADDFIVDLSSYNAVTDYRAMRRANSSGWSKATQGNYYTNAQFSVQMNGMHSAGMKPGAYHFPDPNQSVNANVLKFLNVADNWIKPGCLMPMLDVENDPSSSIRWTVNNANAFVPGFIAELRRQTGILDLGVVVYGSDSWWGSTLRPDLWGNLSRVFLMVANYNGNPGQTSYKHSRLAVHQYTDAAPTPGVIRPTDRSVILPGFSLSDLTIGATQDDTEESMFWFVQNKDTGERALLYPNGEMIGMEGVDTTAVVTANKVPVLEVPQAKYDEMAGRMSARLKEAQTSAGTASQANLTLTGNGQWSINSEKG